jgi:geranylgeranyl diphosphate synthase type I
VTRTLPASLARTRELVSPRLREAADRLSPEMRAVVAYHLGWVEADGSPSGREGKGVRPTLALLSARAAGGPAETGIDGAAAVELVHNFSLLHDDIMDRDGERHHRATAWTVFGEARAILAGDALLTLAVQVLLDGPEPDRVRAAALLADATQRMIEGQSRDLALEGRPDATLDETVEMISRKTAALLSCSSAIGAVMAGGGAEIVGPLGRFGEHVGVSFQAVDDVLGIWGEPSVTGKPAWSDLRQQKRSYPVAVALAADSAGELRELLGREQLSEAELARAADLIEREGGRARALEEAERRLGLALAELDRAPVPDDVRSELAELARFITARDF